MADAGMSHVENFSDPTARIFLTDKGRRSLDKTLEKRASNPDGMSVSAARVMADMMALRTSAIDTAVRAAVAEGATQLVILGAGFDGRAWRMPELEGVKVFEVDHPATQASKRTRVAELPQTNANVTFVPVDFARDSLDVALKNAGHDKSSPTCWIWEGVVMYLTHAAFLATLAGVKRRSAAGSTLIVNYHAEHRGFWMSLMFRLIGEPQISAWLPPEMAADLRSVGFEVREDTGMMDWNATFARGAAHVERARYMRIAVATKS
jgi:methyltransferase (TIGR00027 family)